MNNETPERGGVSMSGDGQPLADWEGNLNDAERVESAMADFARDFGFMASIRLESCIHCGMCADACHFYLGTEDPKYTPIWKVEPFKQAYKREAGPFAPFYRALGLKRRVSANELAKWQHLLYDSCNLCGRCSLICPMGIDVAQLIEQARHGMFDAGLAPKELYEAAHNQHETGNPDPAGGSWKEKLLALGREHDVAIPLDKSGVDVMLCASSIEIERYPGQVVALLRVMEKLGVNCTFRSEALLAENYAYFAGSRDWQADISRRVIEAAIAAGARVVLVPECGHAYTALRWEAADLYGKPLPFRVLHVAEYLAERLDNGDLRLQHADGGAVAFHDPCQIVRKGGVMDAPRKLMAAMGLDLREMENRKGFSFCCGGGGGVILIKRAAPLRYRAIESKLREIDDTGAETLLTSCTGCRYSFDDAREHFNWDKPSHSLLELVADHLA